MADLSKAHLSRALADIGDIRSHLAAGTLFRGFGPAILGVTGILALTLAAAQAAWLDLSHDPISLLGEWVLLALAAAVSLLGEWVLLALAAAVLIGVEMVARARRHHGGLADAMLLNAVAHFAPFGLAGALIGAVLARFAPDTVWVLPGVWQILTGLGLFASVRFMPRSVAIAGAWYFAAGAATLIFAALDRSVSPWSMGLPFGTGQLLLALLLHNARERTDD